MAAAARVDPKTLFTPEEWAPLAARSSWKGLALIAHAWLVIFAAGAMAVVWPLTLPLAWIIIGGRQLGLAILMHDAAHGALHKSLKVNDFAGEYLTGGGLVRYRTYHLGHHRFAQQAEDPDLGLSAPFPITALSLRRKVVRDLTGQTAFKLRFGDLVARLRARKPGQPLLPILAEEIRRKRRWLLGGVIITAVGAPFGAWWAWPVLWVLPQFTWFQLITRMRNIAEHACIAKDEPDPMRHARTTKASLVERMMIAPYYVNYHCEHHMFMHVPCYNLPRAHRMLDRKGVTKGMLVEPGGYLKVMAMAAGKPASASVTV
ncbi:fatty acid desaturase family protein [Phenylobacterium sp.]|uniref:fatty acid desaturase family protein n=1 Tax=Phenylobacterium sp. TaxID=1871053 RepID=UPI00271CA2DB|nr:fatty acid desaturase family protein [Phenylobacterium sp.]MDO8380792.1 fatty acid desaturase family protein [Phenylobacterium sp.]